jgi:hypothetical protein
MNPEAASPESAPQYPRCKCRRRWCSLYQVYLTPHEHELFKGNLPLTSEERDKKMAVVLSHARGPGMIRRVATFGRALARHAVRGLAVTSKEVANERLTICGKCAFLSGARLLQARSLWL